MTTDSTDTKTGYARPDEVRGVLDNFVFGLRVVLGELKWLLLGGMRGFELRQMKKRLAEEQSALGKWVGDRMLGPKPRKTMPKPDDDAWLHIRQIGFLQDEIAMLEEQRARMRGEETEQRRAEYAATDANN